MSFRSIFWSKIFIMCFVNFWHQQDFNALFKGSIGHVTSQRKCMAYTLKTLFRLFRVLQDLQKRIPSGAIKFVPACSVILGEPESFRNLTYYESENFSDSPLHHIFESESFRYSFLFEKQPNRGDMKYEKLNFRKSVGNLLHVNKLRKYYMNGTVIYKYLLLQTYILQKIAVGCSCSL